MSADTQAVRTLVWWCPDWAAVATGVPPDEPAVVVAANEVVAATPRARREGISTGQRRREAQGRCPELVVIERDEADEARRFEAISMALESLSPVLELTCPGSVAFPTRGPSRYHGGDEAMAQRAHQRAEVEMESLGWAGHARVGVADGSFTASRAARTPSWHPPDEAVRVVALGASAEFLASQPVGVLERPHLGQVLRRLGLSTLGAFAALDPSDVLARFGNDGLVAHRLARGLNEHPPITVAPGADLSVASDVEPPSDRIDVVAFVARSLAIELGDRMASMGLSCRAVDVHLETDHGETHERRWRHETELDAATVVDRVRWQVEGWMGAPPASRPTSGISRLSLTPNELMPARGKQLGFWGGRAAGADGVTRAVARIEALLGNQAATVPEWRGGRDPVTQLCTVPAGAVDLSATRQVLPPTDGPPWPGRVPAPSPATVYPRALRAELVDLGGRAIEIHARRILEADPDRLSIEGGAWKAVEAWSTPWLAEQRWWDETTARRRVRLQVVLEDGRAHLLALEQGRWWLEATY